MSSSNTTRRGITIHRAADAVDLGETDFMAPPTMSPETQASIGESVAAGVLAGGQVTVLVRQSDDAGGFSLVHVWFKAGYPLPRHSHDSDCMYYVISGEMIMGNQSLRPGDSFFVPADAPYVYTAGPEGVEVLEIRHGVASFDIKIQDVPAARWQEMVASTLAHRDAWATESISPTFAANQA